MTEIFQFSMFDASGSEGEQRLKVEEEILEYREEDLIGYPFTVSRISELVDTMQSIINYLPYVPEDLIKEVQRQHNEKLQERGFKIISKVRLVKDE